MSFEPSDESLDEIFEMMLMVGALEIIDIDDDNEPIYRVTEKCKDIFPEFYAMHQENVNQITFQPAELVSIVALMGFFKIKFPNLVTIVVINAQLVLIVMINA